MSWLDELLKTYQQQPNDYSGGFLGRALNAYDQSKRSNLLAVQNPRGVGAFTGPGSQFAGAEGLPQPAPAPAVSQPVIAQPPAQAPQAVPAGSQGGKYPNEGTGSASAGAETGGLIKKLLMMIFGGGGGGAAGAAGGGMMGGM